MSPLRILALLCCLIAPLASAGTPVVGGTLPTLDISERGEITLEGDKFGWQPWSSATNPGKVHVIQYIGAKLAHRDLYKPLTDALQKFPPGSVHVVERILSDFRSGRQSVAEFWIDFKGRFAHIRYFALHDEAGAYLGTLEVTQDLTHERSLEGERRLLQYDA